MAFLRTAKTLSRNKSRYILLFLSFSRNSGPKALQKYRISSTDSERMRQLLCVVRSLRAGRIACESVSSPITLVISPMFLKTARRTSESSSFKSVRNFGTICSVVCFLPTKGHSCIRLFAKASTYQNIIRLTYIWVSVAMDLRAGNILVTMSSCSRNSQTVASWTEAMLLISGSKSLRYFVKNGKKMVLNNCLSITSASCLTLEINSYRILQLN